MTGNRPISTYISTRSVSAITVYVIIYARTIYTAIIRIVMVYRIAPAIAPCGIIVPTPSPVVPAIEAVTVVRSIPSVPWIVPRVIPAVAIIPIPRIYEVYTMVTAKT